MLSLTVLLAAATADVPDWMPAAISSMTKAYNNQSWEQVQQAYNPGAEIIPPTATTFVLGTGAAGMYKDMYGAGMRDLYMRPVDAHVDFYVDGVYHEIGTMESSQGRWAYYARWIQVKGTQKWQIAFHCMSIGNQPPSAKALTVGAGSPPPAWMREMEKTYSETYPLVSSMYNYAAQIIPFPGKKFVVSSQQTGFEMFFLDMYQNGLTNYSRTATLAYVETEGKLVHEIGHYKTNRGTGSYYTRWMSYTGKSWEIELDIMAIGKRFQ